MREEIKEQTEELAFRLQILAWRYRKVVRQGCVLSCGLAASLALSLHERSWLLLTLTGLVLAWVVWTTRRAWQEFRKMKYAARQMWLAHEGEQLAQEVALDQVEAALGMDKKELGL